MKPRFHPMPNAGRAPQSTADYAVQKTLRLQELYTRIFNADNIYVGTAEIDSLTLGGWNLDEINWTYVEDLDQDLSTGASPSFAGLSLTDGTLTGKNSESIDIGVTDDYIDLKGGGGSTNQTIRFDLDDTNAPRISTTTGTFVGVDGDLKAVTSTSTIKIGMDSTDTYRMIDANGTLYVKANAASPDAITGYTGYFTSNSFSYTDNCGMFLGAGGTGKCNSIWGTTNTQKTGGIAPNLQTGFLCVTDTDYSSPNYLKSRNWIVCDYSDKDYDFAHSASSNPTILIHSANQSTTQYMGLSHSGSHAIIATGVGAVNINNMAYGSMYGDDMGKVMTIASAAVWYPVGAGLSSGALNTVGFTSASSALVIYNAGLYKVDWSMSMETGSAGQYVEGGVMVNTTIQLNTVGATELPTANKKGCVGGTGILNLAYNDNVILAGVNETAANDITVDHANLTLLRVGG